MPEFNLSHILLMVPNEGPPLPRFLGIYWPWYKECVWFFTGTEWVAKRKSTYIPQEPPLPGYQGFEDELQPLIEAGIVPAPPTTKPICEV